MLLSHMCQDFAPNMGIDAGLTTGVASPQYFAEFEQAFPAA